MTYIADADNELPQHMMFLRSRTSTATHFARDVRCDHTKTTQHRLFYR